MSRKQLANNPTINGLPTPIWEQVDTVNINGIDQQVRVADYGPVGEIFAEKGAIDPTIWTGRISFAERCQGNPRLFPAFRRVLTTLNQRYVDIAPAAGTRCMDERPTAESFKPGFTFGPDRTLGPQAIGADPVLATFYHVVEMDEEPHTSRTHAEDLQFVSKRQQESGIRLSGHTDDKHLPNLEIPLLTAMEQLEKMSGGDKNLNSQLQQIAQMLNIGCLAVDEQLPTLETITSLPAHAELNSLQRLIQGQKFHQPTMDELTGRLVRLLSARRDHYFGKDERSGLYLFKRKAVELLKEISEAHEPIDCYIGDHKGTALVVNRVAGQTLDSSRVSHDTGHEVQLWGQDDVSRTAPLLFPMPKRPSLKAQRAVEIKRAGYDSLRIGFLVGALMRATEGTPHLIVRSLVEK